MNIENILLLLILAVITVVGYFLKDLPNLYRELSVEKFKGKNEKELQKEAFFRQIKGSDIDAAFTYWTGLMVNMDSEMSKLQSKEGLKQFASMQQKVLMYGSSETVGILSLLMQHVYKKGKIENQIKVKFGVEDDSEEKLHNYKLMFYISFLICSLKKDFTGFTIHPMEILKIKINDIDSNKNKPLFDEAYIKVEDEITKAKIKL